MVAFGVLGYTFVGGREPAPLILAWCSARRSRSIPARHASVARRSDGVPQRPISLGLLITTALLLILMALPSIKKAREEAFQEEES